MRLQQSTWIEVKEYIERSPGIILPTGSTEQHGPMGVLGVDTFCAQAIAWRVGELTSAMVGPCLNVGMSEHHMTFAGSMTLRPSTYIAVVRDCILNLLRTMAMFFITPRISAADLPMAASNLIPRLQPPRRAARWWKLLHGFCPAAMKIF